jgi:hypothetical protein
MGTLHEWLFVLACGVGLVFLEWLRSPNAWERPSREKPPLHLRVWNYLNEGLAGVGFGMVITFQRRVFHGRLLVMFLVVAGLLLNSSLAWRRANANAALGKA